MNGCGYLRDQTNAPGQNKQPYSSTAGGSNAAGPSRGAGPGAYRDRERLSRPVM